MHERGAKRGHRLWWNTVMATVAILAVMTAGAGAAPVGGGTLTAGLLEDPGSLDPHATVTFATYLVGSLNVVESLLYQRADGRFLPWLATSDSVSPDGRVFTFSLRRDVRFSDGSPFDADAVKWNFDRIANPGFRAGISRSALEGYTGATVVDDHTIQIHFKEPYAPFLSYVSNGSLGILSPKTTAMQGTATARTPVGSGPFTVAEYMKNDHITLVRNAAYNRRAPWSDHQGPPYLDRIVWKIIPEDETRAITVSSGETQMVYVIGYGTSGSVLSQLQKDPHVVVDTQVFPAAAYLWQINVRRPPTDDVRVRRAIFYGLNRTAIVKTVYQGLGSPACGLVHPTLLQDPEACAYYPYDPAKAGALLDEAGWKMGSSHIRQKDGRPLQLVINSLNHGTGDLPDVEVVQGQLLELGFDVSIKSQASAARNQDAYQCLDNLSTNFQRVNDPDVLYSLFISSAIGTNFNWSCFSDPEVDSLLKEGRSTLDRAKRRAIYVRLDHRLLDQAVAIPMMYEQSAWVRRPSVRGVQYSYATYPTLSDAYVVK